MITATFLVIIFLIQGCKKDYFNRPPQSSLTAGVFYANDADILSGTGCFILLPGDLITEPL